jgi:phosphoglycerol transferase MdoB-like AlkP superfamily enzyme
MFLAGTVAGLAALELHAFMFVQLGLPVRALVITFGLLFMAGLAGFSSHILRWVDALVALNDIFVFLLVAAGLAILRVDAGSFVVPILLGTGNGKPNQTYKKNQ